jgi:hypothetical protein
MSFSSKILQQSKGTSTCTKTPNIDKAQAMTQDFHRKEASGGGLFIKLSALKLASSFISPLPPNTQLHWIDATGIVKALCAMTTLIDRVQGQTWRSRFEAVYASGAAARILEAYASSNVQSLENTASDESDLLLTPYCSMFAAATAYLYNILHFWDPLWMSPRVHRQLMLLLQRDLISTRSLRNVDRHLAFWQSFVGAYGLSVRDPDSSELYVFQNNLRFQKERLAISSWQDAKAVLSRVAWPKIGIPDIVAQPIWERLCPAK